MAALVFHELLGFPAEEAPAIAAAGQLALSDVADTDQVRHTLSPHSPYSVSPALFGAIRVALRQDPFAHSCVHLGESEAEVRFLLDGTGPFRELLADLGVWDPSWVAPKCDPVEYLDRMGFLDERMLVVHGVRFREPELQHIAARGATIVTCPRGNRLTGAGRPPMAEFFDSGASIAVGTDSLASVPDLNVFAELAEMRELAPHVPAHRLLEAATAAGARALGFEADFGTIEAGKRDRLIAVEVERGDPQVEEQLVSGVDESRIRWL
jgi:cytosine/adenosine deaminase-related metal-dependent hydrolase